MKLNEKVYDVLKWIALLFLPALATLWLTISQIWGLPYGEQIGLTISGVDLFLGTIIGVSTYTYNKELK